MTVFLGTVCISRKQVEAAYMFDREHGIAINAMQGNRASSPGEGGDSWDFSSCGRYLGYILELRWGCTFETGVCSVKSGHLSRYEGHLTNVN